MTGEPPPIEGMGRPDPVPIPPARSCPIGLGFLAGVLLLAGSPAAAAAEPVDYLRQVKPILKQRCYACHGAMKRKAGLRLDTAAAIRRGGDSGPALEPGHVEESLLLERVTESDPAHRMPPEGAPLAPEQVNLLRAWIAGSYRHRCPAHCA